MDFGILDLFGWWMIAGNVVATSQRSTITRCCRGTAGDDAAPGEEPISRCSTGWRRCPCAPTRHFDELREVCTTTLAVPPQVMNAVRNRLETV